jgi:hypothetical protein
MNEITLSNCSQAKVELYCGNNQKTLLPNKSWTLEKDVPFINGHSVFGSFVIKNNSDGVYKITNWQNLIIMEQRENDKVVYQILKRS